MESSGEIRRIETATKETLGLIPKRSDSSSDRVIDASVKPEQAICEYCDSSSGRHVEFALSIPSAQKIMQEKAGKSKNDGLAARVRITLWISKSAEGLGLVLRDDNVMFLG